MARLRSPGYPSIPLEEAVDIVDKIFSKNRHNAIDREAAVKDMGYSGLTGQSSKMLSDLSHYGLIEKVGKGGLRVSETSARILHSHNPQEKIEALQEAAYHPSLFADIKAQWPDGHASENALRAYLIRNGFAGVALPHILKAYGETYRLLQEHNATESHRQATDRGQESRPQSEGMQAGRQLVPVQQPEKPQSPQSSPARSGGELMSGERVVFVDEAGASQYLKVIASGDIDAGSLDALKDFIKRQEKRLGTSPAPSTGSDAGSNV